VALGGTPVVAADVPREKPESLDEILSLAVKNEEAALGIYTKLLGMVEDETHLRVLFENQVLAERAHFEELTKMQRR